MTKYRIIEIERFKADKIYTSQKRLFGFLWWYNFLNNRVFFTQKEAEEAIEFDMWKDKKRIVKTY